MDKLEDLLKGLATLFAEKPAPTKVYDSMRPSATITQHVDDESMVKVDDIKTAMADLITANNTTSGNTVDAIEKINDPLIKTENTAEVDSYGLTKDYRRLLLEYVFLVEGKYFNHPNDPGGETMYGIIKTEARANGYDGPMKDLPKEVATEIYLRKYWKNNGLMNIKSFPVALCIFDFFVNSGTRGASVAQSTVNAVYKNKDSIPVFAKSIPNLKPLSVDGALGAKSFEAINMVPEDIFIDIYSVLQEDKYEDLMRANAKLRVFDEGWENRIIKKIIFLRTLVMAKK